MALVHGILHIPLHKRGNIDREIEQWKADAKRRGIRYTELRDILGGFVKWQPKKAIQVLPSFIK